MTEEFKDEYLTKLRDEGEDYEYIDGYEEGFYQECLEDLEDFLTDMRNEGVNYNFIDGFRDGYNKYYYKGK